MVLTRDRLLFVGLALVLTLALTTGCATIVGATAGELSDNLALASKGAVANKPAFNDGNEFTSDKTTSPPTAPDDPNWMEAEKYTVAQVEFPEVTDIHKIIVKSKDLDRPLQQGMWVSVDYMDENGEWKTIRRWERVPPPKLLTVNTNKRGKAVRVQIKRPPTLFSGGGGGGAGGAVADTGERTIYELEVYKYILPEKEKDEAQESSEASGG